MIWNNEELCRQYIQSCNIQGLFSTPVLDEICLHRFARGENIYREGEPETSCQGLFNQIHKKATKKCQEADFSS